MGDRKCNYRNFRFKVKIDDVSSAGFNEVSGYDNSPEPIESRDDDGFIIFRRPANIAKFGSLTMRKGVIYSLEMLNWISDFTNGKTEPKSITLIAVGEDGSDAASWQIKNARPVKYSTSNFQFDRHEVLFEFLELVHEGMTRA